MSAPDSIVIRFLRRLAAAVCRWPRLFFYPQVFLFVFCVLYTIRNLEFDLSRDNLVGSGKLYHQNFLKFKKEFPSQDDMVVIVESESMDKNRQFIERLGLKLEANTNFFTDVFYKGDLKMMGPKALLFVPEKDLGELQNTLRDYRPFVQKFTVHTATNGQQSLGATNLISLFSLINTQFRTGKRETNAENESLVKAIPALERIINEASASIQHPGTPPSPGINALFGAGEEAEKEMYITFANGQIYLATARAKNESIAGDAVIRLRALVNQTQLEIPGLNVGITGEPVLEADEMAQSQVDSSVASVVSLLLCAFIFIYAYRETGRPIKAVICLVFGLGYTMGLTTFLVGHLNILTITFAPILIGLAIDFGVHLITRYEEEIRQGKSGEEAIEKAMAYTGLGILTGALTTAGAFLAMALTDFKGIQEMGVICGGGMILCLVPMMTMLPVLLLRGRQNAIDHRLGAKLERRARIENIWLQRPLLVAVITLILCAAAGVQFRKVAFDYNLLHMQSKGLPAVVFEQKLINSAGKSVLFAAVVADSPQQAVELEKKIKLLPSVASVESMTQYLTEDQTTKLEMVRAIKKEIQSLRFANPDEAPVNIPELSSTLWGLAGYCGLVADEIQADEPKIAQQLLSLRNSINEFRKQVLMEKPEIRQRLTAFQQALFADIRETFSALQSQDARDRLRVGDLPPALRNRFIGVTGKYLLQVYPKEDVWQRAHQETFVKQLQSIVPEATGTPVQLYFYTELLKKSYIAAAWYALAAIALLVFLHFRSLLYVVLALLPVAIGFVWLVGLMGRFGISFNPANIMTLPLVIGIGVTNGINILNRFVEEQSAGIFSKSTGKAVLVSGLNTMAGFGSLMLAKHQGIASLGFVMSVGVAMCMIAALTFLPALLTLLLEWGWIRKKPSVEHAPSPLGSEEPR